MTWVFAAPMDMRVLAIAVDRIIWDTKKGAACCDGRGWGGMGWDGLKSNLRSQHKLQKLWSGTIFQGKNKTKTMHLTEANRALQTIN